MDHNIILYKLQKYQNKLKNGTGDKNMYNTKIQFYRNKLGQDEYYFCRKEKRKKKGYEKIDAIKKTIIKKIDSLKSNSTDKFIDQILKKYEDLYLLFTEIRICDLPNVDPANKELPEIPLHSVHLSKNKGTVVVTDDKGTTFRVPVGDEVVATTSDGKNKYVIPYYKDVDA
jgi:hypothetical protein